MKKITAIYLYEFYNNIKIIHDFNSYQIFLSIWIDIIMYSHKGAASSDYLDSLSADRSLSSEVQESP